MKRNWHCWYGPGPVEQDPNMQGIEWPGERGPVSAAVFPVGSCSHHSSIFQSQGRWAIWCSEKTFNVERHKGSYQGWPGTFQKHSTCYILKQGRLTASRPHWFWAWLGHAVRIRGVVRQDDILRILLRKIATQLKQKKLFPSPHYKTAADIETRAICRTWCEEQTRVLGGSNIWTAKQSILRTREACGWAFSCLFSFRKSSSTFRIGCTFAGTNLPTNCSCNCARWGACNKKGLECLTRARICDLPRENYLYFLSAKTDT